MKILNFIFIQILIQKKKKQNKETIELAENILAIRKTEYIQGKFDIKNTKAKRTFLNYFSELAEEKQKKNSLNNYNCWYSTLQHLKKIVSANFTFDEIDENFVKKVRNYFDNKAITKSSLPLSQNSKYLYFNKFKASIRKAFEEGIFQSIMPQKSNHLLKQKVKENI